MIGISWTCFFRWLFFISSSSSKLSVAPYQIAQSQEHGSAIAKNGWQVIFEPIAAPFLWLLFFGCLLNAYFYTTASRPYRLLHADPQMTPTSKKAKGRLRWVHFEAYQPMTDAERQENPLTTGDMGDDTEPIFSSPSSEEDWERSQDDEEEEGDASGWQKQNLQSAFHRHLFGDDFLNRLTKVCHLRAFLATIFKPRRAKTEIRYDVLELRVWDPSVFQTHFFRYFPFQYPNQVDMIAHRLN